jgi:hypothetical protein
VLGKTEAGEIHFASLSGIADAVPAKKNGNASRRNAARDNMAA